MLDHSVLSGLNKLVSLSGKREMVTLGDLCAYVTCACIMTILHTALGLLCLPKVVVW